MDTDNQLLERYASTGSESAFRELVERRVNLVHSAALRESQGNISQAEDITQAVFTELARRATSLTRHPALAGWLYTCVRQMTANVRRADIRRQRREQEAFTMTETLGPDTTDPLWQELRPVLDDVMHELDEGDRTAVVLRYFEGRNLKEVGLALGLTESGARMRVERSLEKLRGLLSQRGVKSTASTLTAVLAAGAVLNAPSTLASTVATSALTAVASGGTAGFTLAKLSSLAGTKTVTGASLALVVAFLVWQSVRSHRVDPQAAAVVQSAVPGSTRPVANADAAPASKSEPPVAALVSDDASPRMMLQLFDAETGEPLPEAKLHLFYLLDDGRGKTVHQTTDARGRSAVDMPPAPHKALNLFVTANGHVPMVTSFGFRRAMPIEYTMRLERGITVGGVIVDDAGRPVSGAKIQFEGPGNDMALADNIQFGPDTVMRTDVEGRWSCNMVLRNCEQLTATISHPEYAEASATIRPQAPDANSFVITLKPGFRVSGVVEDLQGKPVSGAMVREVRTSGDGARSSTTEASGSFELKSVKAGELVLAVQVNGFAPAVKTFQVNDNVSTVRFQLGPGQLLRGHVVDDEGRPLTNAFVETTRRGMDKIKWSAHTDAEGRFEWNSAPTEPLLYSFLAEGYNRGHALSLKADGSDHEIKLSRYQPGKDTIQITGTVVDADTGHPLDEFKVMLGERQEEIALPLNFYTTGKEGRFSVSLPAKSSHPGYQIQIEKEGYLPAVSTNLLKKDGNQTLAFSLRLGSGPVGVVLLPGGDPAPGATVLLCTSRGGVTLDGPAHVETGISTTSSRTETDTAGKFSLAAATAPQGVIAIHDQGYAEISLDDLASTGRARLQPWGSVEGKLILDSKPVADATVVAANHVYHYDDLGNRSLFVTYRLTTKTDSAGRFSFNKVPPGKCRLFQQRTSLGESRSFYGSYQASTVVTAGAVSQVLLGGGGRTITGKARLAGDTGSTVWQGVPVHLSLKSAREPGPRPQRSEYSSLAGFVQAMDRWDDDHQERRPITTFCDGTGAFRLTDVPAGTYELTIEIRDFKTDSAIRYDLGDPEPVIGSFVREISVSGDQSTEPLDLGALELGPRPRPANASAQ